LVTGNPEKAASFYSSVFGWEFSKIGKDDINYWVIKQNGQPIGGVLGLPAKQANLPAEWIQSLSVANTDDAVKAFTDAGGGVLVKPTDLKGRGRSALVKDPQGAVLSIIHAEKGDPVINSDKPMDSWLWSELWSNDYSGSVAFYSKVANVSVQERTVEGKPYTVVSTAGKDVAGILKNPVEAVRSHWIPYIRVEDAIKTTRKVFDAGGRVLLSPRLEVRKGTMAVLQDPTGAPFVIQEYTKK
jgi:uncharacterized protein